MARASDRPRPVLVIAGGLLSVGVLLGVWIALAGQLDRQDLIGGGATAVVAAIVGFLVSQEGRALPSFRRRDLRQIAAFPVQVVVETAQVFWLAARKAAGRDVPLGSWVKVPIDAEDGGWPAARRDSVLTALLSVTPNSIVVDLDLEEGVALVHRLTET